MFDKIIIRAKVSHEECVHLAKLHHLQVWTNDNGTDVDYRSNDSYKKFTGISIKIQRNVLTLSTSLHKYWNDRNYGRLRNDNIFTVSEAKSAFEMLLFENGLIASKTKVILFEIGLNMNVSYNPLTFIELVKYVPHKNDKKLDKVMFIDANFQINRQKTSEKHKDFRRYFKIYDKGWEMNDKVRTKNQEPKIKKEYNILRIETVYRRKSERSDKLFSDENINRLVMNFYKDWKDLFFFREVRAYKGARKSEIDRVKMIVNHGAEEYLQRTKEEFRNKKITEKQYRTIMEFIRDYDENSKLYKVLISPQEKEYNTLLYKVYDVTRK